jgi:hypothetical protein
MWGIIAGLVIGVVAGWWLRGLKPLDDVEIDSTKQSMAEQYRSPKKSGPRTTGRGGQ